MCGVSCKLIIYSMKIIPVLLCLCILFFFSCSKEKEEEPEELDATGIAFIELVMQRETWLSEWEIIEELGTPQPNKSRLQKNCYLLPVKVKKDAYYAIFYPLESEKDETAIKLGNPKCTTETCTEKELYNQKFEVSKNDWEETEPRVFVIEIRN